MYSISLSLSLTRTVSSSNICFIVSLIGTTNVSRVDLTKPQMQNNISPCWIFSFMLWQSSAYVLVRFRKHCVLALNTWFCYHKHRIKVTVRRFFRSSTNVNDSQEYKHFWQPQWNTWTWNIFSLLTSSGFTSQLHAVMSRCSPAACDITAVCG